MVQEAHDGALAALITRAAIGAAIGALLLVALGLLAELLRRRSRAHRVLALLDLTVPIGVRTAIVSLLALLATFTGVRPAGADDSVRGWLGQTTSSPVSASPATPTTAPATLTTSPPVPAAPPVVTPTPAAPAEPVPAPPLPTTTTTSEGPVALIPPLTITRPGPALTTSTTAPRRTPSTPRVPTTHIAPPATPVPSGATAPAVVAPPTPAATAAPELYVVQRDDCLWAIAARRLGSRADGRTIDTAWRQIYAANRAAIGDNPNLIHIGLTLTLPPLTPAP